VLSQTPGRLRLHLPDWDGGQAERIEARLRDVRGVEAAHANPLTGNVLVLFDPRAARSEEILAALCRRPERNREERGSGRRLSARSLLRVGVRGLLGHAVVDALWFGAGFLGQSLGLPLAGLGPLHLLMDVAVWGAALASADAGPTAAPGGGTHSR
jgi:hypothetical protein